MGRQPRHESPDRARWSLVDAYTPEEMARKVETVGLTKARADVITTLTLALIAGAYVAFGAAFSVVAMASTGLGYSPTRLLGGLAFSLAIVLVVVGGADLFTSSALLVMGWASRRITLWQLMRNWGLVLLGNLVGVSVTVGLFALSGHATFGGETVGVQTLETATSKLGRAPHAAVAAGILGNALICLAVWLAYSARSTTDRIVAITGPSTAMVALEFDHVVSNAYYHLSALLIHANEPSVVATAGLSTKELELLAPPTVLVNLGLVALGNMIGGGVLVAAVYWFVYVRGH